MPIDFFKISSIPILERKIQKGDDGMNEIEKLNKTLDEVKELLHDCDYGPERNALIAKYKEITERLEKLKGTN